jgi:hypothetical protein
VRRIVTEDLGMRKISAKMVPRILTDDQKQRRLHFYTMQRCLIGSLHDETWRFQYDPETKRQSMQWQTEFTSADKSTHVSLAVQDNAYVFLRSQGDSSL